MADAQAAGVDVELLKREIKKTYASVSQEPERDFMFPTGRAWAADLDYPEALLARVPEGSAESFAGVANPFSLGELAEGEDVLDLGCGGGWTRSWRRRWWGLRDRWPEST